MSSQGIGQWSEVFHKGLAQWVRGDRPKTVLDANIRTGKRPGHFELDWRVVFQFLLDEIGIPLENQKGRNGNVRSGTVVRHDGFRGFAGSRNFVPAVKIS